jgi:ABC-type polysaccharide/polyol phosphate transport system ATPase subunit
VTVVEPSLPILPEVDIPEPVAPSEPAPAARGGSAPETATSRAARRPIADDAPVAISVEDLGVKYTLRLTKKRTLRASLSQRLKRTPSKAFWALRNVSFEVQHGESLGVIGPNGAGKSTLLQVLAGIITPSEGEVMVDGHISSLLTLGVGFDQDLSGTDNIRLAGAFMGIDHKVVEDKLADIVDYADLGEFIDAPIKTYSSGMRARLGFAIATSVEPDILILDEVLSTGDAAFREKSKQRVAELLEEAKAIVLVTHDMNWVREYCTRAILLERGRIVATGSPDEVVRAHQERSAERKAEAKAAGVFNEVRAQSAKAARRRKRRAKQG